jgi:heme-degrading monooxygenase HmoA
LYARLTNISYPPGMRSEVVGVARGLPPILKEQRGFNGLLVLTLWETEADAKEGETNPSYIGQMSMVSSFLSERLAPETYQVDLQA